ncbi:hypothetical protein QBC46DRAFT_373056 [Diplogelasinospora grovesii]|uniref:Secreted protein n=1 Tax=Diplogelasinospora grovesii TaxID=303347 RepID=A0AAN6S9P7_9PEZI|nr:hypothetical protein QBC46DRAFT_373056 [Diplogelasinospora grovesii]
MRLQGAPRVVLVLVFLHRVHPYRVDRTVSREVADTVNDSPGASPVPSRAYVLHVFIAWNRVQVPGRLWCRCETSTPLGHGI